MKISSSGVQIGLYVLSGVVGLYLLGGVALYIDSRRGFPVVGGMPSLLGDALIIAYKEVFFAMDLWPEPAPCTH